MANATVTVNGGIGIACDLGPSYVGSYPAAAVQAFGSTPRCAANYDFTQTQQWTDEAGTHQWCAGATPCSQANMSSWFTCGWNTSSPYLFAYAFQFGPAGSDVGCDTTHQTITTDGGVQVLALSYYLTDKNAQKYSNNIVTVDSAGIDLKDQFRPSLYLEAVFRFTTPNPCGGDFCAVGGISTFNSGITGTNPCFFPNDDETDSGFQIAVGASLWSNHPCGTPSGHGADQGIPNIQLTTSVDSNYQTTGQLKTIDTTNNVGAQTGFYTKSIINGLQSSSFIGTSGSGNAFYPGSTGGLTNPADASIASTPLFIYAFGGPSQTDGSSTCGPGNFGGECWTATSGTIYIQRITLWECQNYKTQACTNTPDITTAP